MAWCNYCRRYTVNGRCPSCGRQYEFPKNIVSTKEVAGSGPVEQTKVSRDFSKGFWLGIGTNFGALIMTRNKSRQMKNGAIVGMIINSVFILHILSIIIYSIIYHFAG